MCRAGRGRALAIGAGGPIGREIVSGRSKGSPQAPASEGHMCATLMSIRGSTTLKREGGALFSQVLGRAAQGT